MKKILFLGIRMLNGEHLNDLIRTYGEFELTTRCIEIKSAVDVLEMANDYDIIAVDDCFDEAVIMRITTARVQGRPKNSKPIIRMKWYFDNTGIGRPDGWEKVKYTVNTNRL